MDTLPKIHFTDSFLLQPTNPVMVNLIGAGGTGSQILSALARINHSLISLRHPGFTVRLFDDDIVTEANLGRQLFADAECGLKKATALINRINRFFGTNWKAIPYRYSKKFVQNKSESFAANITISCVDTVKDRFEIAGSLLQIAKELANTLYRPVYWIDFGNDQSTGQVILSTVGDVKQPPSKKYLAVKNLPFITNEFKELLQQSEKESNTPSCSLAEALQKQDLFINSSLANLGASLLWNLFRKGMIEYRGFFLNLKDFRTQPIPVA